jgi:superfamily II DNA or RNA helicase
MAEITIREKLILDKKDFSQEKLQARFTWENPVHIRNMRLNLSNYKTPKTICVVQDNGNGTMALPRGLLVPVMQMFPGSQVIDKTVTRPTDVPDSRITLRDYQQEAVSTVLKRNQGILIGKPGSGKTVIAAELILRRKQQSLICVHTKALGEQWRDRLKTHAGIETGFIGNGEWDLKPVTIALLQSLTRRMETEFTRQWGFCIFDECHHLPAESFSIVANALPARFRLGLTATRKRADGLTFLLDAALGGILFTIGDEELRDMILKPAVHVIETGFKSQAYEYGKLLQDLVLDPERNELILRHLIEEADRGHSILVLSRRVVHVRQLNMMLKSNRPDISAAFVVGTTRKDEREEILHKVGTGEIKVLFSCLIGDEGLDLPILSRVFIVAPSRNISKLTQQVGRIQRIHYAKKDCVVLDFRDKFSPFAESQFRTRLRFYKQFEVINHGYGSNRDPSATVG